MENILPVPCRRHPRDPTTGICVVYATPSANSRKRVGSPLAKHRDHPRTGPLPKKQLSRPRSISANSEPRQVSRVLMRRFAYSVLTNEDII